MIDRKTGEIVCDSPGCTARVTPLLLNVYEHWETDKKGEHLCPHHQNRSPRSENDAPVGSTDESGAQRWRRFSPWRKKDG